MWSVNIYNQYPKNCFLTHLFYCCSGEAAHLAGDFDYVCVSEFPTQALSEHVAKSHKESAEYETRKNAILSCK